MIQLNDMYLFSKVVEHNGISGAAKALGIVHSRVSRRIKVLETNLGVRLIQRSTRSFAVTELGKSFNVHCLKMIAEAETAIRTIEQAQEKPSGLVRVSCPTAIAQFVIGPILPLFLKKNPDVRIALETTERNAKLSEYFDLSIRIQLIPYEDSSLIVRSLGIFHPAMVASPALFDRLQRPQCVEDLMQLPALAYLGAQGPYIWTLISPDQKQIQVQPKPVLFVDDYVVLRQAVLQGMGITQLPLSMCHDDIRKGALEIILPQYPAPVAELHAVFPSRRGMLPAVRSLIDFLSAHCVGNLEQSQITQHSAEGRYGATRFWSSRRSTGDLIGQSPQRRELPPNASSDKGVH
jgi:DNA-binding transcriptional LysR family regulator